MNMNMNLKRSRGFTLIELVVVIVILGVLAVSAAPKFINLKSDAIIANMSALEGSLKSANQLVYSKSIVQNETIGVGIITIGNVNIDTSYGTIKADTTNIANAIDASFTVITNPTDSFSTDWGIYKVPSSGVYIFPNGYDISSGCQLYYIEADENYAALYSQTSTGC
jgi:MSHA pilin protein MshA